MSPEDAATLAALHLQYRELGYVLERLESAEQRYVPPPPPSWIGPARRAYGSAVDGLLIGIDLAAEAVRSARFHTTGAIQRLQHG